MKRTAASLLVLATVLLVFRAWTRLPQPTVIHAGPPVSPMATAIERGREVYQRYGCTLCHGPEGKGGFPNPNAETDGKVPGVQFVKEGYTESELRQKILEGARTIGKADRKGPVPPYRMPGWRDRMTRAEANDLVQYLFSLYPKSAEQKWR